MSSILVAAVLLVLAVSADAEVYKNDKCYKKVVTCCYKYSPCGYVKKDIPASYACDSKKCHKKCNKVCKDVCKDVTETIPKKTCVPAYKKVCTKSYDYYRKESTKCTQVANGESCKTTNTYKTKKVCHPYCENKCADVCYMEKATCSKVKTVQYPKWCAGHSCGEEAVEGDGSKPGDHVSTKAIFLSESEPVRKIIGKY